MIKWAKAKSDMEKVEAQRVARENELVDRDERELMMADDAGEDDDADSFIVDDTDDEGIASRDDDDSEDDPVLAELHKERRVRRGERVAPKLESTREELFGSFGPAPFKQVEEGRQQEPVYLPELYDHRGKDLAWMNREEFYALMRVEKITHKSDGKESPGAASPKSTRPRAGRYNFGSGIIIEASHQLRVLSKQTVLVWTHKIPLHPGPEPKEVRKYRNWRCRADKFAQFVLTMFRPEEDHYDDSTVNALSYDWPALMQWISSLKSSRTALSKLRLASMNHYLFAMKSSYHHKRIFQAYRGESRDCWKDSDREAFGTRSSLPQNFWIVIASDTRNSLQGK